MADSPAAIARAQLLADLTEFVRALDRRTPALESAGELRVAEDAAALKLRAMQRISQLESER
jgi:hypothetical protein